MTPARSPEPLHAAIPSSPLRFDGRVAIVTGSGRGLEREHALLLARLGAAVVVNSTTSATAEETVRDITLAAGKAIAVVGSVVDRTVADSMVKAAIDSYGRVDIVINNAGYAEPSDFVRAPNSNLWDMLSVHVGGSWNVTQAAWPYMQKQKSGRVIMIVSTLMFGAAKQATYAAAKMALVGLVKSIAIEGKEHDILVNCISTAGFSPGTARGIGSGPVRDLIKRYMPAADVAPPVLWLAHEECKITGETLSSAGRLVSRIFLAETKGFLGSADQEWGLETIRSNWNEVVEETEYAVHNDTAEFGPRLFQRLSAGSSEQLSGQQINESFV